MKIIFPVVRAVQVGTAYNYGTDIHYTDGRAPRYAETIESPVVEFRAGTSTVFDYDFKAAQRAKGVGKLVAMTGVVGVAFPLALLHVGAGLLQDGIEFIGRQLGSFERAVGIPNSWTVRGAYAAIIKEIAA